TPGETYKAVDSSDASKITYYTPVFSGFQAGVSYAPEADQGDSIVRIAPAAGFSDFIEGGVAYTGDFSGIGVKASGTISTAEANAVGVDEFTSWALGAQVSYAGISFGGNYVDWDEASGVDNGWTIGLGYTTGPISVAANYQGTDYINGDEVQIYGVGGAYVVAQGLAVRADYVHVDRDTVADETDIVLISTRLSF
ncbi:MAG TPA: porin, partial [Azospirillaceae bacterium]|nr:porin [Azospirillaceae bacterium]